MTALTAEELHAEAVADYIAGRWQHPTPAEMDAWRQARDAALAAGDTPPDDPRIDRRFPGLAALAPHLRPLPGPECYEPGTLEHRFASQVAEHRAAGPDPWAGYRTGDELAAARSRLRRRATEAPG